MTSRLTMGEVVVGGASLALAVVAWSSLTLATFGHYSLIGAVVLASLAIAPLGLMLFRMHVDVIGGEVGCLVVLAGLCLFTYLPGWTRAFGDLDPGVYLAHGAHIARTGALAFDDPVVDTSLDLPWADADGRLRGGSRFPGFYVHPQHPRRVVPQFFALYPSLLATAGSAFGLDAMSNLNPVLATLSVLLLFLVLQRAVGRVAGMVGAALFAQSVVEVYYARLPNSEILAQALLLAAILALLAAVRRRAPGLAFLSGAGVALTFLARPEGIVAILLAGGGIAAAVAGRRHDRLVLGFVLGLLAPMPHALLQAYSLDLSGLYSRQNGLPGPWTVGFIFAATIGGGLLVRLVRAREPAYANRAAPRLPPWAVAGAFIFLGMLGVFRPLVFPPVVSPRGRALWTELGVWRLALFLSPPGFVLGWVGILRACFGRWRAWRLAPLLPLAFLPLVLFQAQVANPYLIPWSRRLVVYVLPSCFFLVGAAADLGWASRRSIARAAVGGAVAAAVFWSLHLTAPLWSHREGEGSRALIDEVGQLAPGRRALVLFTPGPRNPSALALGGPVWSWHDQTTVVLPDRAGVDEVGRFLAAFPDQPAFLVTGTPPPRAWRGVVRGLERARVARVPHFGMSRLAPLVVDESFPVLVYRLGPALSCTGEDCYGEAASREVPPR